MTDPAAPSPAPDDLSKNRLKGDSFTADEVAAVLGATLEKKNTYRDLSTAVIIPTRGTFDHRTVSSLLGLKQPINHRKVVSILSGGEVADAYNSMVSCLLAREAELGRWAFLMTIEDDMIVPPDAHLKLLKAIGDFDGVSAVYRLKRPPHEILAFGDPKNGPDDFLPRPVEGDETIEVNGIGMGCALFKMDLFRKWPEPWFETVDEKSMTHDLFFCKKARSLGARFGVAGSVRCGHINATTGEAIY